MITKFLFICVLFCVCFADTGNLSAQEEWEKFKTTHQKAYTTPEEESKRFQIFQDNLKIINNHNEKYARGESTFSMGVNQFADLTFEEFKNSGYVGGIKLSKPGKDKFGRPKLGGAAPRPLLGLGISNMQ